MRCSLSTLVYGKDPEAHSAEISAFVAEIIPASLACVYSSTQSKYPPPLGESSEPPESPLFDPQPLSTTLKSKIRETFFMSIFLLTDFCRNNGCLVEVITKLLAILQDLGSLSISIQVG